VEICRLTPESCNQVAHFHLLYLSTPFRGLAGRKLLSQYYQAICKGKGASGYIAIREGELLGYVCGVWDAHELQKILLQTRWLHLTWWGTLQMIGKPSLFVDFINRLRMRIPAEAKSDATFDQDGYELRPLVVSPAMRGSGLALQLVERLREDARLHGYPSMYLYAELDNLAAERFYRKAGFRRKSERVLNGRPVMRFEKDLNTIGKVS